MGVLLFPPYAMLDEETSECIGQVIAITNKVLAEYGLNADAACSNPSHIYQLMADGDIDFTINIKQTSSLAKSTIFIDTPFRQLQLNMYSHNEWAHRKDIAGIRGFTYQGQRANLTTNGYTFYDMPTSISAIQLFLKKQSAHLLSYASSIDYLVAEKQLDIDNTVQVNPILAVNSHYAISATSKHRFALQHAFNDYAKKHKVTYFKSIKTDSDQD